MPTPSDAERKARAEAEKAEADARLAVANAAEAEREAAQHDTDLAARQREAEAQKAIAEAEKAARDARKQLDPALDHQKSEAEARKSIAEANKAAADARQAQVAALIPDFSKIEKGETTLAGSEAILGAALARHALEKAVETLIGSVIDELPTGADDVVLITDDPDLATSDAAYTEVTSGLEQLTAAADQVLNAVPAAGEDFGVGPAAAVVGAVAAAIPPLVSLFSPKRTVTTFAVAADNTAAIAQVAGRLTAAGKRVRIDDFRLVPAGRVSSLEQGLRQRRASLVQRKLEKDAERIQRETQRATSQQEVDDLTKALHALPPTDDRYADVATHLDRQRADRDAAATAALSATTAVNVIDDLLKSVDAFLVAVHAMPAGGTRSALASAALREELRAQPGRPQLKRVLFVNASSGSAIQSVNDRPLWFKDKFESIATLNVSYWVIDTATSDVVAAGSAAGSARLKGTFGGTVKIEGVESS